MAYRKSYYEQRVEEQTRIREAIKKQNTPAVEPVVELPVRELPDSSWRKSDIQSWLTAEGIEWDSSMTKSELLEIVK